MEEKTRQIEIGGLTLELPMLWDELSGMYFEDYTAISEHPVYTPEGWRVMLTYEDACPHADLGPGGSRDCGSCRMYEQSEDSLLGVCRCRAMARLSSCCTNSGTDQFK